MPAEPDFDAALSLADRLLRRLDSRPHLLPAERLAIAIYLILDDGHAGRAAAELAGPNHGHPDKETGDERHR